MKKSIRIVWFKRDLRINDHAPLLVASQSNTPVLPLYVVEPDYWKMPFASRRHWHFIHDCLNDLNTELMGLGQPLIIKIGTVCEVLTSLQRDYDIEAIYAHEETGNQWTYLRDIAVKNHCSPNGIPLVEYPSNGVVRKLHNRNDWAQIRNTRMAEKIYPKPEQLSPVQGLISDPLPPKDDARFGTKAVGLVQKGGRVTAVGDLRSFLNHRSHKYLFHISAPGASDTYCSRLSAHLAWGSLSVREVVQSIKKRKGQLTPDEAKSFGRNLTAFGSRLAWRCHFIQKIEDQPQIETHCMHPAFEGLRVTEHNEAYYQAWASGQTGYPFVDACMRNLIDQGWITFRMRAMLVSFASYQLWLDWRITGHHLARLFTDYEPGIHYSQLQMQSGVTGINAMRVYNPVKQSKEHDPTGVYIRKWVPELRNVPDEFIHEPWTWERTLIDDNIIELGVDYPERIVDQVTSARAAKLRISDVRKSQEFRVAANAVYKKLGSRKSPIKKPKKIAIKDESQMKLF